jgi:hypothetical protein
MSVVVVVAVAVAVAAAAAAITTRNEDSCFEAFTAVMFQVEVF